MIIYDIIPPNKLKKLTKKNIFGIENYKTKGKKHFAFACRVFLLLFIICFISGLNPLIFLQKSIIAVTGKTETVNMYANFCIGDWQNFKNVEGAPEVGPNGGIDLFSEENSAVYKNGSLYIICQDFMEKEQEIKEEEQVIITDVATTSISTTTSSTTTIETVKEISFLQKIRNSFKNLEVWAQEDDIFQSAKVKLSLAIGDKNQLMVTTTLQSQVIDANVTTSENLKTEFSIEETINTKETVLGTTSADIITEDVPSEVIASESNVAEENVVSENITSENTIVESTSSEIIILEENIVVENIITEDTIPEIVVLEENNNKEDTFSENITSENTIVESTSSEIIILEENIITEDTIPEDKTPEESVITEDSVFENLIPENIITEDTPSEAVISEENVIEDVIPEIMTLGDNIAPIKAESNTIKDFSKPDIKVIIWYSLDGEFWRQLDIIDSSRILSNALNNGYFEYDAPFLKNQEDIKNLQIKFEGVKSEETDVTFYLDAVWVETKSLERKNLSDIIEDILVINFDQQQQELNVYKEFDSYFFNRSEVDLSKINENQIKIGWEAEYKWKGNKHVLREENLKWDWKQSKNNLIGKTKLKSCPIGLEYSLKENRFRIKIYFTNTENYSLSDISYKFIIKHPPTFSLDSEKFILYKEDQKIKFEPNLNISEICLTRVFDGIYFSETELSMFVGTIKPGEHSEASFDLLFE